MKNFKKMITSAIAGLMAVTALATTAGAAEYYDIDGSCWTDCKYDGKVYVENSYGNYNDGYFVGHDVFLDDIYITDSGYYSISNDVATYLGSSFVFTKYIGADRYNRAVYYRSECGYICYENETWCTMGYNINNIAW